MGASALSSEKIPNARQACQSRDIFRLFVDDDDDNLDNRILLVHHEFILYLRYMPYSYGHYTIISYFLKKKYKIEMEVNISFSDADGEIVYMQQMIYADR